MWRSGRALGPKTLLAVAICAALASAPAADAAARQSHKAAKQPTKAEIKRALRTATTAKTLWATINVCDYHHDRTLSVRGQMPALSFPSKMKMIVTLSAWSPTTHKYVPVQGSWTLGGKVVNSGSLVQNGIRFRWNQKITLIGHIRFEWWRNGKLLGATTRVTRGGHRNAGGAQPKGYSVAKCSIS